MNVNSQAESLKSPNYNHITCLVDDILGLPYTMNADQTVIDANLGTILNFDHFLWCINYEKVYWPICHHIEEIKHGAERWNWIHIARGWNEKGVCMREHTTSGAKRNTTFSEGVNLVLSDLWCRGQWHFCLVCKSAAAINSSTVNENTTSLKGKILKKGPF